MPDLSRADEPLWCSVRALQPRRVSPGRRPRQAARRLDHHHQTPDPALNRTYASPIEFTEALAASPHARRCFVRNVFRSFMGRAETPADACTLSDMEASFAGGSLFKMLETLTTSDTFLYRHDVGVTP